MVSINQVIGSIISGCAVSCGAVLVVAGVSKLYRGTRGLDDMTAIRRTLRMPRRPWRLFQLAAAGYVPLHTSTPVRHSTAPAAS